MNKFRSDNWLTNVAAELEGGIQGIIMRTGVHLQVRRDAVDSDGKPLRDYIALYRTVDGEDLTAFWKRYDELLNMHSVR